MINNNFLNKLSQQLAALLPMAEDLKEDLRTKIEQQLKASFAKLDLLSRSEFDAQAQALARAQQRVTELEAMLKDLGARLDEIEGGSADK